MVGLYEEKKKKTRSHKKHKFRWFSLKPKFLDGIEERFSLII